jgi:hypothetical protein
VKKPTVWLMLISVLIISLAAVSLYAEQNKSDSPAEKIDVLIKGKKYLSAAALIARDKTLMDDPAIFRKYIDLLTDYFASNINGRIFAMKDLASGEEIETIREKGGNFELIPGDVQELIAGKLKKFPDSPQIQFAVGKYLAFQDICYGDDDVVPLFSLIDHSIYLKY